MTTFQQIYTFVKQIPKGKVSTYKQVALICGLANPRIVGFALRANKNPQLIPCHRVVGTHGFLVGYAFGGIDKKKEILQHEGVIFLPDGCVDLNKSSYSFHDP